jgi:hypothetical protein
VKAGRQGGKGTSVDERPKKKKAEVGEKTYSDVSGSLGGRRSPGGRRSGSDDVVVHIDGRLLSGGGGRGSSVLGGGCLGDGSGGLGSVSSRGSGDGGGRVLSRLLSLLSGGRGRGGRLGSDGGRRRDGDGTSVLARSSILSLAERDCPPRDGSGDDRGSDVEPAGVSSSLDEVGVSLVGSTGVVTTRGAGGVREEGEEDGEEERGEREDVGKVGLTGHVEKEALARGGEEERRGLLLFLNGCAGGKASTGVGGWRGVGEEGVWVPVVNVEGEETRAGLVSKEGGRGA